MYVQSVLGQQPANWAYNTQLQSELFAAIFSLHVNKIQVNASFRWTLTRMEQLKKISSVQKILKTMDSHLIVQGSYT